MKMSFENLYMSQSMHELFNKTSVPAAEEMVALALQQPVTPEEFTLEAMIAAAGSYSVSTFDLTRYVSDL
jgi:hypothetical protein